MDWQAICGPAGCLDEDGARPAGDRKRGARRRGRAVRAADRTEAITPREREGGSAEERRGDAPAVRACPAVSTRCRSRVRCVCALEALPGNRAVAAERSVGGCRARGEAVQRQKKGRSGGRSWARRQLGRRSDEDGEGGDCLHVGTVSCSVRERVLECHADCRQLRGERPRQPTTPRSNARRLLCLARFSP